MCVMDEKMLMRFSGHWRRRRHRCRGWAWRASMVHMMMQGVAKVTGWWARSRWGRWRGRRSWMEVMMDQVCLAASLYRRGRWWGRAAWWRGWWWGRRWWTASWLARAGGWAAIRTLLSSFELVQLLFQDLLLSFNRDGHQNNK